MTSVEPGPLTFVNHGCNGTFNIDFMEGHFTEWNVDIDTIPEAFVVSPDYHAYDPSMAHMVFQVAATHRDVKQGDEIFGNYVSFPSCILPMCKKYFSPFLYAPITNVHVQLTYIEDEGSWAESVQELREDCAGAIGAVQRYQTGEKLYSYDKVDEDEL